MLKKKLKLRKKYIKPITTDYVLLYTEHDAFLTMLLTYITQDKFLYQFIHQWWSTAFKQEISFPEGGTLNQYKIAIQYGLLMKAYIKHNIEPTETFCANYELAINFKSGVTETSKMLDRCEQYNTLSQITLQGEIIVATKKKNQKKVLKKKKVLAKKAKAKVVVKKALTPTPKKKAPATGKKIAGSVAICNLLLERKYTDKQIFDLVRKSNPDYNLKVSWVNSYRRRLNAGERKGTAVPKPLLEKIS